MLDASRIAVLIAAAFTAGMMINHPYEHAIISPAMAEATPLPQAKPAIQVATNTLVAAKKAKTRLSCGVTNKDAEGKPYKTCYIVRR